MSPSLLTTFAFLEVSSSTCVVSIDCQNKKKTLNQRVSATSQVIRATICHIQPRVICYHMQLCTTTLYRYKHLHISIKSKWRGFPY